MTTDLYMSPAERLVVFDLCGLGSPARLMSEGKETRLPHIMLFIYEQFKELILD